MGLSHELIDAQNPEIQRTDVIVPMLDVLYKIQTDFNLFFLKLQDLDLDSGDYALIAEKSSCQTMISTHTDSTKMI